MNIGDIRQIMIEAAAQLRQEEESRIALGLANRLHEAQKVLFEFASDRMLGAQGELAALREQRDRAEQEALSYKRQRDDLLASLQGFLGKINAAQAIKEREEPSKAPEPTQAAQGQRYYADPIMDRAPSDKILYWIVKDRQHPGQMVTDDSGKHVKQTWASQEAAQSFAARLNRGEEIRHNFYPEEQSHG